MKALDTFQTPELLLSSTTSSLYRAVRSADKHSVMVQVVKPGPWLTRTRDRIVHDFEVRRDLELDCVARAYSLQERDGHLVLEFEDCGGVPLTTWLGARRLCVTEALSLSTMAAQGLCDIHRYGLAHRSIAPANLIFNPDRGTLKFAGFGFSTTLTRDTVTATHAAVDLDVRYVSPEQTGRMNRSVDYRTDLYSLGVVMFQCLTGRVPFDGTDHLELTYAHLAETPPYPHDIDSSIPPPLSEIVMRLLAKPPEERYQSALGLVADLKECDRQLSASDSCERFQLGSSDLPERLLIPEKLYGRREQISSLIESFERVSAGGAEMVLVAGYSGIGKSALVHQVQMPIVRERGHFITGKFDQFQRHIPYSSLISAFRDLVRLLLTESEEKIEEWRQRLQQALGENGQLIVEVIPEIGLIVGPQPEVPQLPPAEAESRFTNLFQRFVGAVARQEHPLVLFLDDLQWADSASLNLVQRLITDPDAEFLLILGAYRDNEVHAGHPLLRMVEQIRAVGTAPLTITLRPLVIQHIAELLSDTLRCDTQAALPLAELVLEKTAGNPFFLRQFLTHLYNEQLLRVEAKDGCWTWDTDRIQSQGITDNVVELLAGRIKELSPHSQTALKYAACIGHRFNLRTLALVTGRPPTSVLPGLWEAAQAEVIAPLSGTWTGPTLPSGIDASDVDFSFLHDRVQEAAYELIPDTDRKTAHLSVGRLLLEGTEPEERDERIFDIVNQLNLGSDLITSRSELDQVAELNLQAARRAKSAAAFGPARRYARAGQRQLGSERWEQCYELALNLHVEVVDLEYLNSNFEEADRIARVVLENARTLLDKVRVYEIQIQSLITANRMIEALEIALPVLEMLGQSISGDSQDIIPVAPLPSFDDLESAPRMTDPEQLAALRLLTIITGAAYQGRPELMAPISIRITNLCLEEGLSQLAAYGFGIYGFLLCSRPETIEEGLHAGRLSLRIQEMFEAKEHLCRVRFVSESFIQHWQEHHPLIIRSLEETIQIGLDNGDIVYATYAWIWSCGYLLMSGLPLAQVEEKQQLYQRLSVKLRQENGLFPAKIWRQLSLNLQGKSENSSQLVGECLTQSDIAHVESIQVVLTEFFLHFARLMLAYILRRFPEAKSSADRAAALAQSAPASMVEGGFAFYDTMALLAVYREMDDESRITADQRIDANMQRIALWEKHGPVNFESKLSLLEAERARTTGNTVKAIDSYERALDLARRNGFELEAALAAERAADFHRQEGRPRIATVYLREARESYRLWGATAKVAQLDEEFGDEVGDQAAASARPSVHDEGEVDGAAGTLDSMTLIKASQALSGELELDRLLERLIRLAIENAGAERGVFLLNHDGELRIEAVATDDPDKLELRQSIPLTDCDAVPETIVRYVFRTGESVVLADASQDGMYVQDPYVIAHKSRSILCIPIVHQSRTSAVLYLENSLSADVFTEQRLSVLGLLLAQASISLENAELFEARARAESALRESETRMKVVLDALPTGILIIEPETGNVREANPAALEMLELSGEEVIGRDVTSFLEPLQEEPEVEHALETGYDHREFALKTGQNEHKPILKTTREITIAGRVHLLESFIDVSERKRLEAQLSQAQKMEAVGQLAGGVAHDFNNLLQAISGYTSLAIDGLQPGVQARDDLIEAAEAADRATKLVQQLLAFSRREEVQPRPINMAGVIDGLSKMIRRIIGEHVVLSFRHSPNLRTVNADPGQIEQVLVNLCVNARDAMPEGGRITIATENVSLDPDRKGPGDETSEFEYVLLSVSDTGSGMPAEVKERVFEPFFTTKEVGKGTGMGLATVYGIVKQHGGFVRAESELGTGTVFRVYLPACDAEAESVETSEDTGIDVLGGDETVLLAEDDDLVRNMAASALKRAGYEVVTATDGEEAIRRFEEVGDKIDLFILDLIMPKSGGRAVFDIIRAARPNALVLFSSGYGRDTLADKAMPEDSFEVLRKPHTPRTLLLRVREMLDQRGEP